MQIIEWQDFIKKNISSDKKPVSMTIGIFDGVHRGHQVLIKRIVSYNTEFTPAVVTFRQNPKTMSNEQLAVSNEQCDIQTFQQRLAMFEKIGVQIVIVIDFSEEFKQMRGAEFLQILLDHVNIGFFAVGSDFRCGYQLDTDAEVIKKFFNSYNIPTEIIPQVTEDSLPISSSRIRAAIAAGELTLVKLMLGHDIVTF